MHKQKAGSNTCWKSLGTIEGASLTCLDIDHQQLRKKYVQGNNQSCALLRSGFVKQALEKLEIIEKELKERLKNERKVNEVILMATLNNLSAAHQKLGNFNRSLDYIRSLLHHQHSKLLILKPPKDFQSRLQHLNMDISIAKYYLYFLTLTNQLKMFQASTIPANRALQFFKRFCSSYNKSQLSLRLINTRMSEKIFSQIEQFESVLSNSSFWQIMEVVKQSVGKLQKLPISFARLKKFSLQNLTRISEIEIKQSEGGLCFSYSGNRGFQNGLIEFAVCLFLIGKSKNQSLSFKQRVKQDQFERLSIEQRAKQYVLWSLHFACELCPYFTPLQRQIYQYYDLNFNKTQNDLNNKKLKVIDSLQLPSLRDVDAWKEIKRQIQNLQNSKGIKIKEAGSLQQNPILSQKQFQNALQAELKIEIEKNDAIPKKRRIEQLSTGLFRTERLLFEQKNKDKHNRSSKKRLKTTSPISYGNGLSKKKQVQKIKVKNNKKESNTKLKKQNKNNQSVRSMSQRNSIRSWKRDTIQNEQRKINQFVDEYFPEKTPNKKVMQLKKRHKDKQLVSDYLNLQKKLRTASKSLQRKKKDLFKSVKNI